MARSDIAYYPKLYEKSFLLEIRRMHPYDYQFAKTFAFSLPPESVKIDIPQRVNITKTFGGAFVDDYGVDNPRITFSGTTGNMQLKEVIVNGGGMSMNGKQEAYYLLNEIAQYKRNLVDYDKYGMRLYDLSSVTRDLKIGEQATTADMEAWTVVLTEASISRSKDKPLFYSYSFTFTCLAPLGYKRNLGINSLSNVTTAFDRMRAGIAKIRSSADTLKRALASYQDIIRDISMLEGATEAFEEAINEYFSTAQGFISTTIDGINSVFDVVQFPLDLSTQVVTGAVALRDSIETNFVAIGLQFEADMIEKASRLADVMSALFDVEGEASVIQATAKRSNVLPTVQAVSAGSPGSIPAIDPTDPDTEQPVAFLLTYGAREVVATSETRLDVLSQQYFGSPAYADTIATYNGILGDSAITPGMPILIPYLSPTEAVPGNEIYSIQPEVYGTDILLDSSGDVVLAEYNDFGVVSGAGNMGQAINLRASESNGARVWLTNYGIRMIGGGYDVLSMAVLLSSIRDTLIQDPRVSSVGGFRLSAVGDSLLLSYSVELMSGGTASGTLTF